MQQSPNMWHPSPPVSERLSAGSMASVPNTGQERSHEPPRKKMRKGTKSCLECRRRKIRCTYEPGRSTTVCNECYARGSTCVDQEHGDLQASQSGSGGGGEQTYSLRERVTQLEGLVRNVLQKLDNDDDRSRSGSVVGETERAAEVLKNLRTNTYSTPIESSISTPGGHPENAPVLSLFDNAVFRRREYVSDLTGAPNDQAQTKDKVLRAALTSLLPSKQDLDTILDASSQWWTIWRKMFPEICEPGCSSLKQSVTDTLANGSPAQVAKMLLCIAISIDQLPADFDDRQLHLPVPTRELMERYISTVDRLITSDEEVAGTLEGVECMVLQAKYYINLGRPRRAWLLFRRASAYAQLLGLHRTTIYPKQAGDKSFKRQQSLWCALFQGDRYMSLILGLPYSIPDNSCNIHIVERANTEMPSGELYLLRLSSVISRIVDRNQDPTSMSLSATLQIDQELEQISQSMPRPWWEVDPSLDVEDFYDRVMAQFFHHQIKALLHLPFMLKSATDRKYQYSHMAAIEASRDMLLCYQALRAEAGIGPYICKVIDFQAFTAAMLLLLNLLGYAQDSSNQNSQQEQKDWEMVDKTIDIFRRASNEAGGIVAAQSARALELIGEARHGCEGDPETDSCKVSIPYFGTVTIGAGRNFKIPKQAVVNTPLLPAQLLTPPDSQLGSVHSAPPSASQTVFADDPFISFDSYMPMPQVDFDTSGMGYADPNMASWQNMTNLDLDQSWNWFGNMPEIQ